MQTAAPSRSRRQKNAQVRTETRNGIIYVIGRDGIAQPCSSPRVAALVVASVRNLGRA